MNVLIIEPLALTDAENAFKLAVDVLIEDVNVFVKEPVAITLAVKLLTELLNEVKLEVKALIELVVATLAVNELNDEVVTNELLSTLTIEDVVANPKFVICIDDETVPAGTLPPNPILLSKLALSVLYDDVKVLNDDVVTKLFAPFIEPLTFNEPDTSTLLTKATLSE